MNIKLFILALFALLLCVSHTFSQEKGALVGKISDKESNNDPLPFANVLIKNTTKGTQSDFDGLYEIADLDPGTYTLIVSFIGYETSEIPNITIVSGKVTEINVPLGAGGVALNEVVVTTVARKDSEVALLLAQKKAIAITQSIGAAELSRKGVGDAQAAVTKVTGVSKQEGAKNVFVRGLGDRYNSTSMNGLPLPSEDPEYKNIALDFFSSDIINSIGVNKTFGAGIYSDVGGANIDIVSKELYGSSIFQIGLGVVNFNTRAVRKDDFLTVNGANRFGTGLDKQSPITNLDVYDFENSYLPDAQNLQLNNTLSFQLGKRFSIGENTLSAFVVGALDSEYMYQEGNTKVITAQGLPLRDLDFEKYLYNISQIAMGNFKYNMAGKGYIALNSLFIYNSQQSVGEYNGDQVANIAEEPDDAALITRQQVNNNTLFVNQLLSTFTLTEKIDIDAGIAYNRVKGNEPDRRQSTFVFQGGEYRTATGTPQYNHRFFSQLEENELTGNVALNYNFGTPNESKGAIQVGYNYRNTDRNFDFLQFNHSFGAPVVIDPDRPDNVFNQQGIDNGDFFMVTGSGFGAEFDPLAPFFYEGSKEIHSGFANGTYAINDAFTLNAGVRVENIYQLVNWNTNISSSAFDLNVDPSVIDETYILPNVNAKYNFNENSILRFAASKTYTFPQFKEVAPFVYEDVNFSSFGNPNLNPSDNFNFDLKYEYYFSSGELLSLTGFYKKILNPINRIQVNSAANQLSYINSGDEADVAGLELEFRKNIFEMIDENDNALTNLKRTLSFGFNASYLYSRQDLTDESTTFTNIEDELEGASPLLLNADFTYNYKKTSLDITSSLVFNYFSDRIYSIGVQGIGNMVETGIPTLDFILRSKIAEKYGISLSAKNLLDPNFQITQDDEDRNTIIINTYKKGILLSLGFNYTF